MNQKISRNDPCPCGSGKKYKKCCFPHVEEPHKMNESWVDGEGVHLIAKGAPPSPEVLEEITKKYQENIRKSELWKMMLKEYGIEKAEKMLNEFQVIVKPIKSSQPQSTQRVLCRNNVLL